VAEKFVTRDLERAVDDFSTMRFFPAEGRAAIMRELAAMCPHREALRWLVSEALAHVPIWPGLAELRGLLCTRYDAADGRDAYCTLPGYSPTDQEAKHLEAHENLKLAAPQDARRLRDFDGGTDSFTKAH
jgi:hypothetical protein